MILLGSRACAYHDKNFRSAEDSDWDIIASLKEAYEWAEINRDSLVKFKIKNTGHKIHARLKDGSRLEIEICEFRKSNKILNNMPARTIKIPGGTAKLPLKEILYLTKRSHIYWPIRWRKNIEDLAWMQENGWSKRASLESEYYHARLAEHKSFFKDKTANLNMTNDEFFGRSEKFVNRVVDHDNIHDMVSYYDTPLYEQIKHDTTKAAVAKDLWDGLSKVDKDRTVREEAMAIAIERYLLSNDMDQQEAYDNAVRRICTNLTSGWFRDWAIDNWSSIHILDLDIDTIANQIKQQISS